MGNQAARSGTMPRPALDRWRSPVADCIVTDPARLACEGMYAVINKGDVGFILRRPSHLS